MGSLMTVSRADLGHLLAFSRSATRLALNWKLYELETPRAHTTYFERRLTSVEHYRVQILQDSSVV